MLAAMLPTAVHTAGQSKRVLKVGRPAGHRTSASSSSCHIHVLGSVVSRFISDRRRPIRTQNTSWLSSVPHSSWTISAYHHPEPPLAATTEDSKPWHHGLSASLPSLAFVAVAAVTVGQLLLVGPAAASEILSSDAIAVFKQFLEQIAAMGPWGPVLFVASVSVAEMIPLFPTQPLCLASGLLFGPLKGTFLVLLGVTIAAFNAFSVSKGIGKSLAQKMIKAEMSEEGKEQSIVGKKLAEVQQTIERGSFWEQFAAIVVLRLTPVVPFSASNYILGLTPLKLPVFLAGTVVGMVMWSIMYASLGGASRALLENGADMGALFGELAEKAGAYTSQVALVALAVAAVAGAYWLLASRGKPPSEESEKREDTDGGTPTTTQPTPQLGPEKIMQ